MNVSPVYLERNLQGWQGFPNTTLQLRHIFHPWQGKKGCLVFLAIKPLWGSATYLLEGLFWKLRLFVGQFICNKNTRIVYLHIHVCTYIYIYTYISDDIQRVREREREGGNDANHFSFICYLALFGICAIYFD